MGQLVQACRANEVTDLILVHEHRGEPGLECTMIMIIIVLIIIIILNNHYDYGRNSFLFGL